MAMTRVNADLPPDLLLDQHLMAEYRELPMVPAALRRSLRTRPHESIMSGIPESFTLNKGHVTFFYNKMKFLRERYQLLQEELLSRKYGIDLNRKLDLSELSEEFFNDCIFTPKDRRILVDRISHRVSEKPTVYTLRKQKVSIDDYLRILFSWSSNEQNP